MTLASIPEAIRRIRSGRMIIVADDEDRENEGDLVVAADRVTPEAINFMTRHGRGLICVAITQDRADELGLEMMIDRSTDPQGTAFTVSVDAHRRFGVTTGISAQDRAQTVRVIVDPDARPDDLRRPGHVFPLRAEPGGVLRRVGQTEAAVDLARLAGLSPAGVICEILNADGTMARRRELEVMAKEHDLCFITVEQLVAYRLARERLVRRAADVEIETAYGPFRAIAYETDIDERVHLALVKGAVREAPGTLVRMHGEDLLGDVFGIGKQPPDGTAGPSRAARAMKRIQEEGAGVLVYIRQVRAGERLLARLEGAPGKKASLDGAPPALNQALKDYGVGAQILLDLGLSSIRLLTGTHRHLVGLDGYAIRVAGREAF